MAFYTDLSVLFFRQRCSTMLQTKTDITKAVSDDRSPISFAVRRPETGYDARGALVCSVKGAKNSKSDRRGRIVLIFVDERPEPPCIGIGWPPLFGTTSHCPVTTLSLRKISMSALPVPVHEPR